MMTGRGNCQATALDEPFVSDMHVRPMIRRIKNAPAPCESPDRHCSGCATRQSIRAPIDAPKQLNPPNGLPRACGPRNDDRGCIGAQNSPPLEGWTPKADGVVGGKPETPTLRAKTPNHPALRAPLQRRGIRNPTISPKPVNSLKVVIARSETAKQFAPLSRLRERGRGRGCSNLATLRAGKNDTLSRPSATFSPACGRKRREREHPREPAAPNQRPAARQFPLSSLRGVKRRSNPYEPLPKHRSNPNVRMDCRGPAALAMTTGDASGHEISLPWRGGRRRRTGWLMRNTKRHTS
jgi:hypothetical protein